MNNTEPVAHKITLQSEQGHNYLCRIDANNKDEAILQAHNKIDELGWEHFKYKILSVIPIFKAKLQTKD